MVKRLCVILLLLTNVLLAQVTWDSSRYVKYQSRFVLGFSQAFRQYSTEISQFMVKDTVGRSKSNYFAESDHTTGIDINYDKIGFSIGLKSTAPKNKEKTGSTKLFNIGLNLGGNRWLIETAYRRYQGFYDKNSPNYDTSFKRTGIYYQDPKMVSTLFKCKFIYFTNNKKFSYRSSYGTTFRQLKSAATWIVTANAYYNTLNSDSSFIPVQTRPFYQDKQSIHGLDVFAFSVYGGAAVNLIMWRSLFVNLTVMLGPEEQWRTYKYIDGPYAQHLFYMSLSGDVRFSAGLNTKRFYMILWSQSDFFWQNSSSIGFLTKYATINFSIGYRFKVKVPKFYQKFQQSKFYKKF